MVQLHDGPITRLNKSIPWYYTVYNYLGTYFRRKHQIKVEKANLGTRPFCPFWLLATKRDLRIRVKICKLANTQKYIRSISFDIQSLLRYITGLNKKCPGLTQCEKLHIRFGKSMSKVSDRICDRPTKWGATLHYSVTNQWIKLSIVIGWQNTIPGHVKGVNNSNLPRFFRVQSPRNRVEAQLTGFQPHQSREI